MFDFFKEKKDYLIKNISKKSFFEKDFSINPINSFIFLFFSTIGFILYFYYCERITNSEEFVIFLLFPIFGILGIMIGKWEMIVKINFIGVLAFFWWKGFNSFYFIVPVSFGVFLAPIFQQTKEWERAVILRFGKFNKIKGPGLFLILPFTDIVNKIVDLRIRATDFVAETTLTKDSVAVTVDALAFWMIWDPEKAILEVENYTDAVVLSSQAALRDAIGKTTLTKLLEKREEAEEEIRKIVDKRTNEWGITIQSIDITEIIIPQHLQDTMSKKAQAEREKESRIVLGESEIELAKKFEEAAKIYKNNDTALKLRSMNILFEGLKAGNSTMMVPATILDNMNLGNFAGIQALSEVKKSKKNKK
ncbi:MAG: hypothetical protein JXB50_06740 [Spirochaetes bacterium]|nr:hypothetical protein [Spirochaetota bacterium]